MPQPKASVLINTVSFLHSPTPVIYIRNSYLWHVIPCRLTDQPRIVRTCTMSSEEMPIIEDVSVRRIFNQSRKKKNNHARTRSQRLTNWFVQLVMHFL